MSEQTHVLDDGLVGRPLARQRATYAAIGLGGVILGLAASVDPMLALGAAAGAVLAGVILASPSTGLCILLALSFFEEFDDVGGGPSVTKVVGMLLGVAWLGAVALASRAGTHPRGVVARQPMLAAALALFAVWTVVSGVWATDLGLATDSVTRFALNFALFPIVLAFVVEARHVVALFSVYVAAAVGSAAYGLLTDASAGTPEAGRLAGAGLNPNELGAVLVVAVVFGVALGLVRSWHPLARAAAFTGAALATVGIFLTLSRGALFGLAVAILVAPLAVGRGRRVAAVAVAGAAIFCAVAWFGVFASESARERVTNPSSQGGSGRADLWKVGWRMVEDHPVRGVGAGNFPVRSVDYLLRPGRTEADRYIVDTPKVPHNIYLAVLAELGIVGFLLFVAIIVSALAAAVEATRQFTRRGQPLMDLLSRTLLIGLVGYLAALFFSSQLFEKQLWLLLATAPALLAIAQRTPGEERMPVPLGGTRLARAGAGR
jgi:putative inorganic carbon (hco3(-)) transporter